jgi:hypothetical protein
MLPAKSGFNNSFIHNFVFLNMGKKYLLVLAICFSGYTIFGQSRFLQITINNNKFSAGDTIHINADYVNDFNEKVNGTLYAKIVDDSAKKCWNYRWPIMNGLCSPKLLLEKGLPIGNYHFYFAARDEQFLVKAELQNRSSFDELEAVLYNRETMVVTGGIKVPRNGAFNYTNPYFINAAVLNFKNTIKRKPLPELIITSMLDSAFVPTASKYVIVEFGLPFLGKRPNTLTKNYFEVGTQMNERYRKLQSVTVKAKRRDNSVRENSELEKLIRQSFENSGTDGWYRMEEEFDAYRTTTGNNALSADALMQVSGGMRSDPYGGSVNPQILEMRSRSLEAGFAKFAQPTDQIVAGKNTFIVKGYSAPVVTLRRSTMSDF